MRLSILSLALGAYALKKQSACIEWQPCSDAANVECASYDVPLDYAHPEVGKATLALARIKAFNQPGLGTLFVNPGGPAGSGTQFLKDGPGELISSVVDGRYDIVSWDPRGVNQTLPLATCGFTSEDDFVQTLGTLVSEGVEARGNFTDQDDLDSFFAQLNVTDLRLKQFGEQCMHESGDVLKYMGSAAVARDIVSLSDCLEGPWKLINYLGISYGTVIGTYFVNMFPERVGRVIIDGVIDSIIWATEPSYKLFASSSISIDSVFAGFTQECAKAGPQRCLLAQNDSTPASIAQNVREIIDAAYDRHKAGDLNPNHTSVEVRSTLGGGMNTPSDWGGIAGLLAELNGTFANITSGSKASRSMLPRIPKSRQNTNSSSAVIGTDIATRAIVCVDSIDQDDVTTERVFDEVVRVTHEVTPLFGELLPTFLGFMCHRFPIRAVERFTGPFNNTLANPILVVSSKLDPATPLASAKKIADTLGNSARLLIQDGFGHTSFAESSNCTIGALQDYLLHGTLPEEGKICEVDQVLFPPNDNLAA